MFKDNVSFEILEERKTGVMKKCPSDSSNVAFHDYKAPIPSKGCIQKPEDAHRRYTVKKLAYSLPVSQLLLLHTCAADLLFALVTLGTEILTLLSYPHFGGSDWLCKAMRYGQVLPLYASPFLLVAISADRYQ
ncbi:hypothetical protein TELCIR_09270, partial [Teladorsagia circumcincta]